MSVLWSFLINANYAKVWTMRSEMIKVPRRTARAPFHFRETRSRLHSFLIHYIIMASKRRVILQVSSSDSDQSPSSSPLSTPVSTKKRVSLNHELMNELNWSEKIRIEFNLNANRQFRIDIKNSGQVNSLPLVLDAFQA